MPTAAPLRSPLVSIFSGFGRPDRLPWEDYKAAGIGRVYLGLNDEDDDGGGPGKGPGGLREDIGDEFTWRWGVRSRDHLARGLDEAHTLELEVVLMPWWRPTEAWMSSCAAELLPVTDHPVVHSVLGDLERGWHKVIEPGLSHQEAIDRFFVPAFVEKGVSLGITCYADPVESSALLLPHCDYVLPQCYTPDWWTQAHLQPGAAQKRCARLWGARLGEGQRLVMGGGLYRQARPGLTAREAVLLGARASHQAGVQELAYWSWPASTRETRRALADLALGRVDLNA